MRKLLFMKFIYFDLEFIMNYTLIILKHIFAMSVACLAGGFAAFFVRYGFVYQLYDNKLVFSNNISANIFIFLDTFLPSLSFGLTSFIVYIKNIPNNNNSSIYFYLFSIFILYSFGLFFSRNSDGVIFTIIGALIVPIYIVNLIVKKSDFR
jgi:hypothetical protein